MTKLDAESTSSCIDDKVKEDFTSDGANRHSHPPQNHPPIAQSQQHISSSFRAVWTMLGTALCSSVVTIALGALLVQATGLVPMFYTLREFDSAYAKATANLQALETLEEKLRRTDDTIAVNIANLRAENEKASALSQEFETNISYLIENITKNLSSIAMENEKKASLKRDSEYSELKEEMHKNIIMLGGLIKTAFENVSEHKTDQIKGQELLKMAQHARIETPDRAMIYYMAALDASPQKTTILLDYLDWQKSVVQAHLKKIDFEKAINTLVDSVHVVDSQLYKGTLEDLSNFEDLNAALTGIEVCIQQSQGQEERRQALLLAQVEQEALEAPFSLSRAAAYQQAAAKLDNMTPLSSLEEKSAALRAKVEARLQAVSAVQSLQGHNNPAIAPFDSSIDIAETWINAYIERLNNQDVPVALRQGDSEVAVNYLTNIIESLNPTIKQRLNDAEANMNVNVWKFSVKKLATKLDSKSINEEDIPQIEYLYMQGKAIFAHNRQVEQDLSFLAGQLFQLKIDQIRFSMETLKNSEIRYSQDILLQLAAQYRVQAVALSAELQNEVKTLPTLRNNNDLEKNILSLIQGMTDIYQAMSKNIEMSSYINEDKANYEFRKYVDRMLSDASNYYENAELNKDRLKTVTPGRNGWDTPESRANLSMAIKSLYSIDLSQGVTEQQRNNYMTMLEKLKNTDLMTHLEKEIGPIPTRGLEYYRRNQRTN
ncbi:MAG: hypothetical protein ACEB74_06005 [Desulfovibrio aminophilus]|uniref:hypothetical protein n=1 Tax=Desulfovibrio aminophilus TaxID=81425 RepID=UPI0039E89599